VKLTVLGCSGSMAGPDSPASGYLIEADGFRVLLELGNGAFGALQRHVAPTDVDAIILSHLHPDHCIDMTSYIVALRYGPQRQSGRIPLYGPASTKDRIEAAYDPFARKLGLHELFDFATPADAELGPFAVSFARVNHPVPAYAIRLRAGDRTLAFSGDTGESEALVGLATGADLFLCEASFSAREEYVPDLHLTGAQAGEHARRAGVGRLVVTHVQPWNSRAEAVAEAAAVFGPETVAATPGAVFEI
jgi:ribonuclease BN (tRNA processing enzyme)